jgi:Domain of unknown function (DUF4352)
VTRTRGGRLRRAVIPGVVLATLSGCHGSGGSPPTSADSGTEPEGVEDLDPGVAPSAEPRTPDPEPIPRHAVGETARLESWAVSLEAVERCDSRGTTHPRKGKAWLGAKVALEAIGPGLLVSPRDARLLDAAGGETRVAIVETSCAPALEERRLRTGQKTDGWLVFEVPEAAKGLELRFEPIVEPRTAPAIFELPP